MNPCARFQMQVPTLAGQFETVSRLDTLWQRTPDTNLVDSLPVGGECYVRFRRDGGMMEHPVRRIPDFDHPPTLAEQQWVPCERF